MCRGVFFKEKHFARPHARIGHMLGHKRSLKKFKTILNKSITWSIFSDHNEIKLEINNRQIWDLNTDDQMGNIACHSHG